MAKTIREAYGKALVEYGALNDNLIVLDCDVSSSTKTAGFSLKYPERFFNLGIAESNMVGIAAGLASVGKIPFANTFAVFITTLGLIAARNFGAYTNLNIKLIGAYGGLSPSYDGASHQSLEDIAIMRSLPRFQVFVASDEYQTKWFVKHALENAGPMYIRLSREAMETQYSEKSDFQAGRGFVLTEGDDVTIIACGLMVQNAMKAVQILKQKGITARVIDMFCIKPIDADLIISSAKKTGAVVTAEEHSVIGGLGSAVSEVLASNGTKFVQEFVGVKDRFTESGDYKTLQSKYALDADAIAEACVRACKKK